MDVLSCSALLESYIGTNWSDTPVAYENVDARNWTEVGQPLLPDGTEDYLAVRQHIQKSEYITVPGTCRRYFGTLYTGIMTRDGTGTRNAEGHAKKLIELFEGIEISSPDGMLRMWSLTGSHKYRPAEGWYAIELAFNFSFERYVAP